MGFALFTSSGTFNPSDYGLVPGDVLNVVVVGGGAGGSGLSYNSNDANTVIAGTNGSASSFGSVVSAAGGEINKGGKGIAGKTDTNLAVIVAGGDGLHGWQPSPFPIQWVPSNQFGKLIEFTSLCEKYSGLGGNYLAASGAATFLAQNGIGDGAGSTSTSTWIYNVYACPGRGGLGYGAGGGGAANGNTRYVNARGAGTGGGAGQVKTAAYKLPSTSGISVTVGAAGNGGNGNQAKGGAGAPGCVAIFW